MFHLKRTQTKSTLLEDQYTFSIISLSFLLRMKNVSNKSCRETRNTHFMLSNVFFENRTICEIMCKNFVNRDWLPVETMAHAHYMLDT